MLSIWRWWTWPGLRGYLARKPKASDWWRLLLLTSHCQRWDRCKLSASYPFCKHELLLACSSGVTPKMSGSSTQLPLSTSGCTTSSNSCPQTKWSAVLLYIFFACTSAPALRSAKAMSLCFALINHDIPILWSKLTHAQCIVCTVHLCLCIHACLSQAVGVLMLRHVWLYSSDKLKCSWLRMKTANK